MDSRKNGWDWVVIVFIACMLMVWMLLLTFFVMQDFGVS